MESGHSLGVRNRNDRTGRNSAIGEGLYHPTVLLCTFKEVNRSGGIYKARGEKLVW